MFTILFFKQNNFQIIHIEPISYLTSEVHLSPMTVLFTLKWFQTDFRHTIYREIRKYFLFNSVSLK